MITITVRELFSIDFYRKSALANLLMLCPAFFMKAPNTYYVLMGLMVTIMAFFFVESFITSKNWNLSEYKSRYIEHAIVGMTSAVITTYFVNVPVMFYVCPFLGLVYQAFNYIVNSKLLARANFIMVATAFVIVISKTNDYSVYIAICAMMIVVGFLTRKLYVAQIKHLLYSVDRANSVKEMQRMINSITKHDIRNLLAQSAILSLPKYRENVLEFMEKQSEINCRIVTCMDEMMGFDLVPVDVSVILNEIMPIFDSKAKIKSSIPQSNVVKTHPYMLKSTIINLINNSCEASKEWIPDIFIETDGNHIRIVDKCGGFDVEKIKKGSTTKSGKGHGIFLKTICDPAVAILFGFSVKIMTVDQGTCVEISFVN
jgi:hypothetical protein